MAVIPGNHDLWASPGVTSRQMWESRLQETVEAAGFVWLEGRSLVLDRIAVAGTIGWYGYSAADPAVCEPRSRFVAVKRYFIPDAKRINWA